MSKACARTPVGPLGREGGRERERGWRNLGGSGSLAREFTLVTSICLKLRDVALELSNLSDKVAYS